MNENAKQRLQVLEILYSVRQTNPKRGWLADSKLKEAMENQDIEFALGVLIETGHVHRNGYQLNITGAGVIACEAAQENYPRRAP